MQKGYSENGSDAQGSIAPKPEAEQQPAVFSITGIRHQLDESLSMKERTRMAEKYVAGLKKGQQVILVAEPENPFDPKAVAAYIDYERIGYIGKEETGAVAELFDDNRQCEAEVLGNDGHLTLFVCVPGACIRNNPLVSRRRTLPESPLGNNVRLPFSKEDSALQMIASRLSAMKMQPDNLNGILELARHYVRYVKLSLCHEDSIWENSIYKKLYGLQNKLEGELESQPGGAGKERLQAAISQLRPLVDKIRSVIGDTHRTTDHWAGKLFAKQFEEISNNQSATTILYQKYCATYLENKTFEEASGEIAATEHERLSQWFRDMEWCEMRDPKNFPMIGEKINYLRLSRTELHDIFAVMLILGQLEKSLAFTANARKEIVGELKSIFYGNEEEAGSFLSRIECMKGKEITHLVNELVTARKISDLSKKRPLWQVLHKYGFYEKTEANWNSQIE